LLKNKLVLLDGFTNNIQVILEMRQSPGYSIGEKNASVWIFVLSLNQIVPILSVFLLKLV